MAEHRYDDIVRDLAALGRATELPVTPDRIAVAVMDRIATLPVPSKAGSRWNRMRFRVGRWVADSIRSRRRRLALVIAAILVTLLATPPVRATVADWLAFGGVLVQRGSPGQGQASPPPEVRQEQAPSEAADQVGFTVWAPEELGEPDGVEVSRDRRVVSMSWSTAGQPVLRLDQVDGRFDFSIVKRAAGVFYASVGGSDALWLEEPHEVVVVEPDGRRRTESARMAGHTLIWQLGDTTLRLEGDVSLARAVEIAESVAPVP